MCFSYEMITFDFKDAFLIRILIFPSHLQNLYLYLHNLKIHHSCATMVTISLSLLRGLFLLSNFFLNFDSLFKDM